MSTTTSSHQPLRIGINGLGRIGRLVLRQLLHSTDSYIVTHVNDSGGSSTLMAYLLEFDSVHGKCKDSITLSAYKENTWVINKNPERILHFSSISNIKDGPWMHVDIVLDCTGSFKDIKALNPYFMMNVQRVLVACPVEEAMNVVVGCNHALILKEHRIVTAASCTTNCIAPIISVLHKNLIIKHGTITTIHDVTNTQVVVDGPRKNLKDFRRARSALMNLAPTSTGSAKAIGKIFPELKGRLNGIAVRVPLTNASLSDLVFEVETPTTVEAVNQMLKTASEESLCDILGFEMRPLVSSDYQGDTRSSIVDGLSTMVVNDTMVKVLSWYDNEMGYACRMVDILKILVSQQKNS